jgi:hypothetical protein
MRTLFNRGRKRSSWTLGLRVCRGVRRPVRIWFFPGDAGPAVFPSSCLPALWNVAEFPAKFAVCGILNDTGSNVTGSPASHPDFDKWPAGHD